MSKPTSYRVYFECGHTTWILPDEHGDGSAYCLDCEDFKTYDSLRDAMLYGLSPGYRDHGDEA